MVVLVVLWLVEKLLMKTWAVSGSKINRCGSRIILEAIYFSDVIADLLFQKNIKELLQACNLLFQFRCI